MDWELLNDYFDRRGFTESNSELICGDVEEFATLWTKHEKAIRKQLTVITVREVEAGLDGKEKDIFVRGLLRLPNLWKECREQQKRNVKIAEAKKVRSS